MNKRRSDARDTRDTIGKIRRRGTIAAAGCGKEEEEEEEEEDEEEEEEVP